MSRKDMQSDEIEEIMKEMLNDDEYADEGFEDIDREDNRHESKKAMKKEKKAESSDCPFADCGSYSNRICGNSGILQHTFFRKYRN